MKPIKRINDWCSHDEYDGKKLEPGTGEAKVRFPDGFETQVTVEVRQWNETHGDMGNYSAYGQSGAYAKFDFHGVEIDLALADTGVLVEFLYPGLQVVT